MNEGVAHGHLPVVFIAEYMVLSIGSRLAQ